MWEFSVGLYMINVWPDSLLFAAIYGVLESASTALFGPIVGRWVDRLTYVKVPPKKKRKNLLSLQLTIYRSTSHAVGEHKNVS